MKIAIPTRDGKVDDHFGHCEKFTIVSISEENKVINTEIFDPPIGCGCKSDLALTLNKMGVSIMLAGNMGMGAVQKISSAGIHVYRGCSGDVIRVTEAFLRNELSDSGETCTQHMHHHQHDKNCQH